MFRMRYLVFLGVCFLAASGAWADEVGYVDCSNHSDATQVFGKPRKTPDVVASLACGERFTILVYGFYFSRIQTKDGQIGYIYSSLIAVDRGATAVQQSPSLQSASEKTKIPSTRALDTKPSAAAPAQTQVASAPPTAAPVQAPGAVFPAPASAAPAAATDVTSSKAASSNAASSSVQEAVASPAEPAQPVSAPPAAAPAQPAAVQTEPAPAQPVAAPATEIAAAAPASNAPEAAAPAVQPEAAAPVAQPEPAAPATPQPAPAKAAPVIRPVDTRETWEKPNPSVRRPPMLELYGGFAFARMQGASGYSGTNFNGALGSFGVNVRPWLQLVGDSSYNFVTVSGTKNVLYANHYGPRFYYRGLHRLNITPFAEAFVGGSRADVTPSGGPTFSQNCISYKVGGGIDYRASRRWEVRAIDFDYYRTSFGTNTQQTNYSISAGVVLRLFGGSNE
jgi:hypothetical protein